MTSLRTLGRLALEPGDFTQPKPLILLAYLALEGPQQRRHMAELLWPSGQSLKSLAMALSRLRRAAPLSWDAEGGRLRCTAECDAAALLVALDADDLQAAETLYRGSFLAGLPQPGWSAELASWALATRERLAERYRARLLVAAERALAEGLLESAADLAAVAYNLAEAPAASASTLHRIHDLLASGRHALAAEAAAAAARLGRRTEVGPRPEAPAPVASLVAELFATPFLGRADELATVAHLLAQPATRLLTLLGPGGSGKTRLALQAAQAAEAAGGFPGGIHVALLSGERGRELLPQRLAEAVGAPDLSDDEPWRRLAAAFGSGRRLLLLDGLEPSPEAAGALSELLDLAPGLCLLLTCTERWGHEEELVVSVPGLPAPPPGSGWRQSLTTPAVQLLCGQVLARRPGLDLASQTEDVQRVCQAVEGLPLALELAAGCLGSVPASDLLRRIRLAAARPTSPSEVGGEPPDGLQAIIRASWEMLEAEEREAVARLAAFVGGFRREAAEAVAGARLSALSRLLDLSWLRATASGRLDSHPRLHAFARQRLGESPHVAEVLSGHADWFADLAHRAETRRRGPEQLALLRQVAEERANLLVALDHYAAQDPARGLALAVDLAVSWSLLGRGAEALSQLRRFLTLCEAAGTLGAMARLRIAQLSERLGEEDAAHRSYQQVLAEAEALNDRPLRAEAHLGLGRLRGGRGDDADALLHAEAALLLARAEGRAPLTSDALRAIGTLLAGRGALREAATHLEGAAALAERGGDLRAEAAVSLSLAEVRAELGERGRARWLAERGLELFRLLGDNRGEAAAASLLAAARPSP